MHLNKVLIIYTELIPCQYTYFVTNTLFDGIQNNISKLTCF